MLKTFLKNTTRTPLGSKRKFGYLMVSPAFIALFMLSIYPMVYLLVVSLHRWSIIPTLPRVFIGLRQYINLLTSSDFYFSLWITLLFTFSVVAVEMILGFILAYILLSTRIKWLRVIFLMPTVLSPIVIGLIWRFNLGYDLGMVNYFLNSIGLSSVNWLGTPKMALVSIIIVDIWQWTPFAMMIYLAGLESLPMEPFEAAVVDGASAMQILRLIVLPQLRPIIAVILMFRSLDAFKMFDVVYMMTQGGPGNATEVLSYKIWHTAFFQNRVGAAAALSVIMIIIANIMMQFFNKVLKKSKTL